MNELTKNERMQIKAILQSPQWDTIERMANLFCSRIREKSVVGSTQWETLQTSLINEGFIQGVRKFFQSLYDEASKND